MKKKKRNPVAAIAQITRLRAFSACIFKKKTKEEMGLPAQNQESLTLHGGHEQNVNMK